MYISAREIFTSKNQTLQITAVPTLYKEPWEENKYINISSQAYNCTEIQEKGCNIQIWRNKKSAAI